MSKTDPVVAQLEAKMKERIVKLNQEFGAMRTGRASPQIIEGVKVEAYGQLVPLKQVAAIAVPEARTLEVRPWDPSVIGDVEKALQKADLGAMPKNDGKVVRVNLPPMTEDRRKELVKVMRRIGEEYRVSLRADRHEAIEKARKAQMAKEITQDELRSAEARIQKVTDQFMAAVDREMQLKEKELVTV
ncbi:MAG: ribosome recycling factor [Elusimicrobia bacterium]|nr:ribosome recycling factor [Elusimicrobiota bacterium]